MKKLNGYFQGKKILLTGASGYIASALLDLLKDINCRIICLDRKNSAPVYGVKKATMLNMIGDVSEKSIWNKALRGIDIVFHFAAQTSVYTANEHPANDLKANVLPMLYLLETCRSKRIKPTILFSGTVTESGMPEYLPVDETHPDNPITVYDLHKLMAEEYLKYYCRQGFVKGAILRLANVYGPGPGASSADRGILNLMIKRALKGENLTLYGMGEYLRDYVYVSDVAGAFLTAAENMDKLNGRHFVIGSGKGITLARAFDLIARKAYDKTGRKVSVIKVRPPANLSLIETRNFRADSSRFRKITGWRARYSLDEGIEAIMQDLCHRNGGYDASGKKQN